MTLTIIAVLWALFFAGLIIPQKAYFGSRGEYEAWKASYPVMSRVVEALKLNEVYVAPITVFFLTLFFMNLLIVVGHRVPLVLRRAYLLRPAAPRADLEAVRAAPDTRTIVIPAGSSEGLRRAVRSFFKRRFWFIAEEGGSSLTAVRNRFSPLGFLFFHLSFILCLVGGLLVMYTRFAGQLVITEGQEFNADMKQFTRIINDARIFRELAPVRISLDKVSPKYERGTPVDLDVRLKVSYRGKVKDEVVKINEPVKRGAVTILAEDIGVSPLFVLRTASGGEVAGGYFSLNVLKGEEDSFEFEGLPYRCHVRFYPDYEVKDGGEHSLSRELKNPHARIRIEEGGRVLYEGTLRLGQEAAFGDLVLRFPDVRYWVKFRFVREYGNIPLMLGFLFGGIGLVMRLIFYQKTFRAWFEDRPGGCAVHVSGQSEYYRYSFQEEMDRLVADLGAALAGPGGQAMFEKKGGAGA